MTKIEPIGIGGLHRGLSIPEIYIENTKLHNEVNGLQKQRRKTREKNNQLQSNWISLREWLKNKIDNFQDDVSEPILHEQMTMRVIYEYMENLDKMNELEGNINEEKNKE